MRCIAVSGGLALKGQLKWIEEFLPGGPLLIPYWFSVPDRAVAREGVGLENHVRRERGKHVVYD